MIVTKEWETIPKIIMAASMISLFITPAYFVYIAPIYQHSQQIKQKQQTLKQLIEKRKEELKQFNHKENQYNQLQQKHSALIKEMQKIDGQSTIYKKIAYISKKNKIVITQLKPKKETISLEIKGSEQSLFLFIKQLQQQTWQVAMPEWQMQQTPSDIRFKAILEIYHAKH